MHLPRIPADDSSGDSASSFPSEVHARAERILKLVDRLLSTSNLDEYARVALDGLLDLMPSLSASYNELNPVARRAFAIIAPDPGAEWFERYRPPFEAHMLDNPLITVGLQGQDTRALTWDDFPERHVIGTTLDTVFYAPNGIRSQLAIYLPAPPGVMIGFALNRGAEGFSEVDRETLDLLKPHLTHAYRAVQLRSEAAALRSVLDAEGWAVVLVDASGRITKSSPGAAEQTADFGVDLRDGSLLSSGPLGGLLRPLLEYSPTEPSVPSAPLRVTSPEGTLVAVAVPSRVGPHVLLLRRSALKNPHAILLQAGFTPRQIDVALALLAGQNNEDIGKALGIAVGTVKKHMEAIFSRLAACHRAEALARLHELLADAPLR